MRLYLTELERDERGDMGQTEGDAVSIISLRFQRSIVRTAPGVDDIAEADLVSATPLKIGDLLLLTSGEKSDVYRVMTASPSSIGRHQYKLTRKLEDAA